MLLIRSGAAENVEQLAPDDIFEKLLHLMKPLLITEHLRLPCTPCTPGFQANLLIRFRGSITGSIAVGLAQIPKVDQPPSPIVALKCLTSESSLNQDDSEALRYSKNRSLTGSTVGESTLPGGVCMTWRGTSRSNLSCRAPATLTRTMRV